MGRKRDKGNRKFKMRIKNIQDFSLGVILKLNCFRKIRRKKNKSNLFSFFFFESAQELCLFPLPETWFSYEFRNILPFDQHELHTELPSPSCNVLSWVMSPQLTHVNALFPCTK